MPSLLNASCLPVSAVFLSPGLYQQIILKEAEESRDETQRHLAYLGKSRVFRTSLFVLDGSQLALLKSFQIATNSECLFDSLCYQMNL